MEPPPLARLPGTLLSTTSMDPQEAERHSFIMRIWLEEQAADDDPALWRGEVIHVPTGERRLVQGWDAVRRFVLSFISTAEAVPGEAPGPAPP